jgi:hypothetical protein
MQDGEAGETERMLNDWSDRRPPRPPRPFHRRGEFWLGLAAAAICGALLFGLLGGLFA